MGPFAKFLMAAISICLLSMLAVTWWALFAPNSLPDVESLRVAAPDSQREVTQAFCEKPYTGVVISRKELKPLTLAAFHAAEGRGTSILSWHLALDLTCQPSFRVERRIDELRLKMRIAWKFRTDEIELIYLNRAFFGDEIFGIENASQHYFQKPSSQLSAGESALLIGLIKAPTQYSPLKHPERALERRNHVLDDMVSQGSLTISDAQREKSLPLGVAKS